jgi:GAF domain-containing protein
MKVSKRQLKKVIREERARLLSEQLTDDMDWQNLLESVSRQITDKFGDDMGILFDEDPEAFRGRSTQEEWEAQVHNAQLDLESGLVIAMEEYIADVEARLHGGDYTGRGGPR